MESQPIIIRAAVLTEKEKEAFKAAMEKINREPFAILPADSEIKFLPNESKSPK